MSIPLDLSNEVHRLAALRRYDIMDTPPEPDFDALAELAADICGTPIALVSLVDDKRQWFKARVGLDFAQTDRGISFCGHAITTPDLFVVENASQDARFAGNPLVLGEPGVQFYAGAPLRTPDGFTLGTLCVMDRAPRSLNAKQSRALRTLSREVVTQLELRRRVMDLRESAKLTSDVLHSLTSHVALLDPEGTILHVNDAWKRFSDDQSNRCHSSDCTGGNYLGRCGIGLHFRDAALAGHATEGIRAVLTGHRSEFTLEYAYQSAEQKRWFAMRVNPLTGSSAGAVVVHDDITERKQAEEALKERENQLDLYAAHCPAPVAMFDRQMRYVITSRRWVEDFRIEEPIIGRNLYEVFPEIPERWIEVHQRALDGAIEKCEEEAFHRADGSVNWVRWEVRPWYQADGSIGGVIIFAEDITQRKLAQNAAIESERRLRTVIEHMTEGLVISRLDGELLHWNPAALAMFGFTNSEEWQRNASEFTTLFEIATLDGKILPYDSWPLRKLLRGEPLQDMEVSIRRLDHDWQRVVRFNGALVRESEPLAFITITDITRRHLTEVDLENNRRFLADVIEYSGSLVFVKDPEGRYQLVNRMWEQITGLPREDVLGRSDAAVFPSLDGERFRKNDLAIMQSGETQTIEEYLHENGKERSFLSVKFPLRDAAGHVKGVCGMVTEITARKEAEERQRQQAALLDKARDAILVRDLNHGITFWNKSAERLYGWTAEEMLGRSVKDSIYTDPIEFQGAIDIVLEKGEWHGEIDQQSKDGRRLTVESRWTLVRDDEGQPKCVLAINTDITERKKLEQQFLRAQRMESIGTLAGGIAHDLNNVLGPILMSLELLQLKFTDSESQELISIITSAACRGADMVRQVLSFARGVAGQRLEVQVRHLLRDIEKIVNETFLKHVQVRCHVPGDLWSVVGDATQLHQVLLNLCVNARDAMPNGGLLSISAENVTLDEVYAGLNLDTKPGRYIALHIEDTGSGIAPEIIEKIFDPFFTTKEVGKGTGLGLSTTLAIVKSHGGFIKVYSELEKGTTFKVYLPASPRPSPGTTDDTEVVLPRGNGETVLVIDDESSVRQITQQTLQALGYRVLVACDGAEAIALTAQRPDDIDVVLTDMMMPVMDGIAVIQVLQRMNADIPIIAASGLSTNEHVARATNLGIKDFLPKPYTAETLLKVLKRVLTA